MYGLEAYLLGLKLEVLGNSDRTGTSSLTSLSSWAGHCCAAGRLPIISTMRARSKAFYLLLLDMNEHTTDLTRARAFCHPIIYYAMHRKFIYQATDFSSTCSTTFGWPLRGLDPPFLRQSTT